MHAYNNLWLPFIGIDKMHSLYLSH